MNPLATQQDIVAITGWSKGYVSKLIAAVAGDTPQQLLDFFAKGLQPMTVILLKPVFVAADPSTRDQLAQSLSGCSLETAQKISDSFQKGMAPSAVVDLYCGTKTTPILDDSEQSALVVENSASSTFTSSGDKPVKTENPAGVVSVKPIPSVVSNPAPSVQAQSSNPASRLPSGIRPENYAIVEALALANGTSNALVKALIVKAITLDLDREELENACLISAKCNDADLAVFYLTKIMSDGSSFSAFRQYARSVRLTIKSIYRREKDHSLEVSKALREGVFSPLPLAPRKSDKKS